MSDEDNILSSSEEHKDIPLEQQQVAAAESHEMEIPQEISVKKPSTTPRAIRLATISKLLEKHTTQMDKVGRMVQPLQTQIDKIAKVVQPLQKQLKSVERQTEMVKQSSSQLKQLSQVQKDIQKIRSLLSKKETSPKRKNKKRVRKR